jgi:uncharacterized protein YgbK (DUF1537 family)
VQPELGVLADDLTGATDTGLQFAKCGRRTSVSLSWPANPSCDVLVIDADSRHRPEAESRECVGSATRALLGAGVQRIYKKIDSTGRGNLGGEIEAALAAYDAAGALVCPAFPSLGRTVRGGLIYVRGVSLDRTEFAADPVWPAQTASLERIIRRQTDLPIEHLGLDDVRRGPVSVRAFIAERLEREPGLLVADAEDGRDLRCLAEALRQSTVRVLPVGSAGLAEWLVGSLPRPARPPKPLTTASGPIFAVAGTMNQIGIGQIGRLLEGSAALVALNCELALDDPIAAAAAIVPALILRLRAADRVILALVDPRFGPPDLATAVASRGLTPALATERLMSALGIAAEQAMDAVAPAALILTGGDTARAVCAALAIQALDVVREAAPGVPICRLQGGRWDGLPVITKAGGFGDAETLARAAGVLEGLRA